jgi:hypothetical protein
VSLLDDFPIKLEEKHLRTLFAGIQMASSAILLGSLLVDYGKLRDEKCDPIARCSIFALT